MNAVEKNDLTKYLVATRAPFHKTSLVIFSLIYLKIQIQLIKFWTKILNLDNQILLKQAYLDELQNYNLLTSPTLPKKNNNSSWSEGVKKLLLENGFGDTWFKQKADKNFEFIFRNRIVDNYIQSWHSSMDSPSSKLRTYKLFKSKFEKETYLDVVRDR